MPKFLRPALGQIQDAQLRQQTGDLRGDGLGHGDEGDMLACPASAGAGGHEALFNRREVSGQDVAHGVGHGMAPSGGLETG